MKKTYKTPSMRIVEASPVRIMASSVKINNDPVGFGQADSRMGGSFDDED